MTTTPRWALVYHVNSYSKRAKRWYHIGRFVYADEGWFELYWYQNPALRGENAHDMRREANALGLDLLPGVYRDKLTQRRGGEMERAS